MFLVTLKAWLICLVKHLDIISLP